MLKLKPQFFGHLVWRVNSLEKILMWGKIEGKRRGQKLRWLDSITSSLEVNVSKLPEIVEARGAWYAAVPGVTKSQTWQQLNNKTWGLPIGLNFLQNHFHTTSTFINIRVKASFLAFAWDWDRIVWVCLGHSYLGELPFEAHI